MEENKSVECIAYHGWGFDKHFWDNVVALFPDEINFRAFDRGYFGKPETVEFSSVYCKKILLLHSFGLHLAPGNALNKADVVVLINCFSNIHGNQSRYSSRSVELLQSMENRLAESPETELRHFLNNAFFPDEMDAVLPKKLSLLNRQLLQEDLLRLRTTGFFGIYSAPAIVIESESDRILRFSRGGELAAHFPNIKKRILLEGEGHAFAVCSPSKLWDALQPEV